MLRFRRLGDRAPLRALACREHSMARARREVTNFSAACRVTAARRLEFKFGTTAADVLGGATDKMIYAREADQNFSG